MTTAGQRFCKRVPAAANRRSNRRTVGDNDLYSVRLEVNSVQESSFVSEFNHSAFVRELSVQLWSVNQRTAETEEVTDS
jgi:hypothetical protein